MVRIASDHCRIGSLEKIVKFIEDEHIDHCRIGSLEIMQVHMRLKEHRSLPHRQLRKSRRRE